MVLYDHTWRTKANIIPICNMYGILNEEVFEDFSLERFISCFFLSIYAVDEELLPELRETFKRRSNLLPFLWSGKEDLPIIL